MSGGPKEILESIEVELTRIRRMVGRAAETADDGFLLYLIDMAILEVNHRARIRNERHGMPVRRRVERAGKDSRKLAAELEAAG